MIGELLPTRVRGLLGGYIFCFFNALLFGFTKVYPTMKYTIGMSGVFGIFGASATLATIILFLLLPETKGKSLIQIEEYYQKPNILWLTRNSSDGQRVWSSYFLSDRKRKLWTSVTRYTFPFVHLLNADRCQLPVSILGVQTASLNK